VKEWESSTMVSGKRCKRSFRIHPNQQA